MAGKWGLIHYFHNHLIYLAFMQISSFINPPTHKL
jgi:hypothetical protein